MKDKTPKRFKRTKFSPVLQPNQLDSIYQHKSRNKVHPRGVTHVVMISGLKNISVLTVSVLEPGLFVFVYSLRENFEWLLYSILDSTSFSQIWPGNAVSADARDTTTVHDPKNQAFLRRLDRIQKPKKKKFKILITLLQPLQRPPHLLQPLVHQTLPQPIPIRK